MAKLQYDEKAKPNMFGIYQLLKLLFKNKQFDDIELPKEIKKHFK
jgi:hypothetical protein